MIYTNQVNLRYDHAAIARDFAIFEARRDNGNFSHSKIPDIALQQCRALSVVYDWGPSCYILYHRDDVEKHSLKQTLESYEADVCVHEITSQELEKRCSCRLAQLLFNTIPSLSSCGEMYHNITGKLYYSDSKWIYRRKEELVGFWTLQISITWDLCLKLEVKTFSNVHNQRDAFVKPRYLFDSASFSLRRALKEDPDADSNRFVIAAMFPDRKNTVPFLEFGSLSEYYSCKVGVLHRFLKDVQDVLYTYLTLEIVSLDETTHIGDKRPDTEMTNIRQRLKKSLFYVEDTVQNEQSSALVSMLRQELNQYSNISLAEGTPEKGAVLIRVIHNKEYYENSSEQDSYADAPKDCIVQHVTVEDFQLNGNAKEKEAPSLRKVLQEIAIKMDIDEGQMSCYNWSALEFSSTLTFVAASKPSHSAIHYQRLRVTPGGALHFDSWEQPLFFMDQEQEKISTAFETRNGKFDFYVKGLVYEDIDHIHIIRDTDRYTLPNMDILEQKLGATRDDEMIFLAPIIEVLQATLSTLTPPKSIQCQGILDTLLLQGNHMLRKELRSILNLKSALGRELNQLIYEKTGILIASRIKERNNRERIFGGTLDIRHFYDGSAQYYYSGYRSQSLKWSLPHACRIRKVTSTGEKLNFEKYLPLLEVDFVRASAWTVIPFPFKYLREWTTLQR